MGGSEAEVGLIPERPEREGSEAGKLGSVAADGERGRRKEGRDVKSARIRRETAYS